MTGQHRGQHRDPVHDALKTLVVLGHLAVIGLLGVTVHQETSHSTTAATTPDSDPPSTT
ncbi:hypothetical protein [Kitasatospora aureofaciens]|uniref:hypothetical protein n=1 Tax=Kitasatospora aureofaciens TaxID=1894 RepID=UPI001C4397DF|nr:hypothetical protein [Kitasatospora aureofaciens]MBV6696964.1 hypothetical protein [Kitasatospora aureofaciens]